MTLPSFNTNDLTLSLMQNSWAKLLNPVLNVPMSNGVSIKSVVLVAGDNLVNHMLQRPMQGYIVTSMYNNYSQLYNKVTQQPSLNFILNSSANVTIDLWVF